ncbi:MAG: hypothetical protein ABI780_10325 [Ardenticatenales bacterium]
MVVGAALIEPRYNDRGRQVESMTPSEPREPVDHVDPDATTAMTGPGHLPAAEADHAASISMEAEEVGSTGLGALIPFVGAAAAMWIATAVVLLVVGMGPLLLGASLSSQDGLFVSAWAALLLTVGAAVLGVRFCNRPRRRLVRIALFVGFGLAVLPIGFLNLMLAGSCISTGGKVMF